MKTIRLGIILLFVLALFSGCSNESELGSDGAEMAVYIRITGYNDEIILPLTEVGLYENETVLDVLKRTVKENDIQLDYSGSGITAYVKGIDNLYEFDYGAQSGWIYLVDSFEGTPGVSCGAFELSENDQIDWIYATESTTQR